MAKLSVPVVFESRVKLPIAKLNINRFKLNINFWLSEQLWMSNIHTRTVGKLQGEKAAAAENKQAIPAAAATAECREDKLFFHDQLPHFSYFVRTHRCTSMGNLRFGGSLS